MMYSSLDLQPTISASSTVTHHLYLQPLLGLNEVYGRKSAQGTMPVPVEDAG